MNLVKKISMFSFAVLVMTSCGDGKKTEEEVVATDSTEVVIEEAEMVQPTTIVDVAVGNENFSTLVAAVKAAGLVETLSSEGPFTVFAPTNEAFSKLPAGTVDNLLKPENVEKLKSVLTYHVVAGKFEAAAVIDAINKTTVDLL